ncbi:MAG: hypothetical protein MJK18_05120 [Bdellovibrionales bacterium]|nr:hypothetical protein [Bdellovibrionales bacterium]
MRSILIMVFLGFTLLIYQNCGSDVRTQGLFADQALLETASIDSNCDSSNCVKPEELLWIKILENEPYRVNMLTMTSGHFVVAGSCGVGTFTNHTVSYEMRLATGSQEVVSAGFHDNICDLGQYQAPITPNVGGQTFRDNTKYILRLEILGLGDGNQPVANPMPANVAQIDVIFERGL